MISTGSVTEYYTDVTGGLVHITGEVVGPFTMPQTLAWYANDDYGIGKPSGDPRANIMAHDAAAAADSAVNFGPYDNDGNGYVDAFIVVHAGEARRRPGTPATSGPTSGCCRPSESVDGTKIYAYLTIPEDAKVGVSAHELGHLVFGWPDLYDTDNTSEGIGELVPDGRRIVERRRRHDPPIHRPGARSTQGWIDIDTETTNGDAHDQRRQDQPHRHRLWTDGTAGQEYFLAREPSADRLRRGAPRRQDCSSGTSTTADRPTEDESHYKVALVQADGLRDLESDTNRGDGGDPYPRLGGQREA